MDQKPTPPTDGLQLRHTSKFVSADSITPLLPLNAQALREEVDRMLAASAKFESEQANFGLFEVRPAAEWLDIAASRPDPRMLFDSMWYEGDLCILFADTNVGKSILAVQIGDSISRGVPIEGLRMDAPAQPVAYFDFELSAKQFEARYTGSQGQHYPFVPTFYRAELDIRADYIEWGFKTFDAYLYAQLEHYIEQTGIKVLIIDNITYLRSETEQAKDASALMLMLNTLKKKYGLSLLVLAHTPKRDQSRPIEANHLQGSKVIANLTDGIIAIGKSHRDHSMRYIKQLKGRLGEKLYEDDHVCLCQIVKPDDFLHFEVVGFCTEREHLREVSDKETGQRIAAVKDLAAQGMSQRDIAAKLNLSTTTVNRYINR
jgi:hypothetical protein